MNYLILVLACCISMMAHPSPGNSRTLTTSVADISPAIGANSWHYISSKRASGGTPQPYSGSFFQQFDHYNSTATRWKPSHRPSESGSSDSFYLRSKGGRPIGHVGHVGRGPGAQDAIIWSVRRYVSETDGLPHISYELQSRNYPDPKGGRITGRIPKSSAGVVTQFIENHPSVDLQRSFAQHLTLGTSIELVIDSKGLRPYSGSNREPLKAKITKKVSSIPEPSTIILFGIGFTMLAVMKRRQFK